MEVVLVIICVLSPVDRAQLQYSEASGGAGRRSSPLGENTRAAGGHLRIGGRGGWGERKERRGRNIWRRRSGWDVVKVVLVLANVFAVVDGAELQDSEAGRGADGGSSWSNQALGDRRASVWLWV